MDDDELREIREVIAEINERKKRLKSGDDDEENVHERARPVPARNDKPPEIRKVAREISEPADVPKQKGEHSPEQGRLSPADEAELAEARSAVEEAMKYELLRRSRGKEWEHGR